MPTQHRSNMCSPESEAGYSYPPRRNAHSPSFKPKLRSKKSFRRHFIVRRRKHEPLPSASETQSSDICEFSSTPPSMATSRSSFTSSTRSRSSRFLKPRFTKPTPPVIVPSWRYKAETQTFTVRVETEFKVTCTVVQPRSRFRFGWHGFSRSRICFFRRRSTAGDGDREQKKRRRSFWGVTVKREVYDDAASAIEPQQELQSQPQSRTRSTTRTLREKRTKATRRNSGWAGVFSASESGQGTSAGGSTCSSHDHEQAGFMIDRASKTLAVPGMDVGIARVVKQEIEKIPPTVRLVQPALEPRQRRFYDDGDAEVRQYHVFTSDSDDSWLEIE